MKHSILTSALALVGALTLCAQVPSLINYQGRLADSNGDPVTGSKNFTLSIYDAQTSGNVLYTEDIGAVTLNENGVYNFQFGATGQSAVSASQTIAISDGASTTYSSTLSSTPLDGTLVVADGTNSWNIVDGNPGATATATVQIVNGFVVGATVTSEGEGYSEPPLVTIEGDGTGATATASVENGAVSAINITDAGGGYTSATLSIAAPPAPYSVTYETGSVNVTYEAAPEAGTEIVATYNVNEASIVGALNAANTHWLELSIDGVAQSPRERVLSVPFAQVAGSASNATGILANEISALKHPGFKKVTEVGAYKTGGPAVVVGAGYRMEVLNRGIQTNGPTTLQYGAYVYESIKLSGLGPVTGYQNPLYIDGPAEVSMTNDTQQEWFNYQIGTRAGNGQVGTYKVGEPAVVVEAGYRMKVLAEGGFDENGGWEGALVYIKGLGVRDEGEGSDNDFIDGPAEVSLLNAQGFFTYEINEFVIAD